MADLPDILASLKASQVALREIYDATEGNPKEAGTPKSYLDDALVFLNDAIGALELVADG